MKLSYFHEKIDEPFPLLPQTTKTHKKTLPPRQVTTDHSLKAFMYMVITKQLLNSSNCIDKTVF